MEVLLFEPEIYAARYNCSFYDVDSIPIEQRQRKALGVMIVCNFFFLCPLYIAVLYAMLVCDQRGNPTYRMMFALGILHILGLSTSGFFTGILSIEGAVFCSRPTITYWAGLIGLSAWCACSSMNLILGFSRCCLLYSQNLAQSLFGDGRVWLWIGLCYGYFFYVLVFSTPPVFSGIIMAWNMNPHYGYFDDFGTVYSSRLLALNNAIACTCEICVYTTLLVLYFRATHMAGGVAPADKQKSSKESRIYVQVIIVGLVHVVTSSSYVVLQFFRVNFYATLLASTFYLTSQGLPPIIYLIMNATIRRVLLRKLRRVHSISTHATDRSTAAGNPQTVSTLK